MIFGIGTDIVSVTRLTRLHQRYGDRTAQHFLSDVELSAWQAYQNKLTAGRFIAKRFAAKEALAKALGIGLRSPLHLTAVGVVHDDLGKPLFQFNEKLACWMQERQLKTFLSISDEEDYVISMVVVEQM